MDISPQQPSPHEIYQIPKSPESFANSQFEKPVNEVNEATMRALAAYADQSPVTVQQPEAEQPEVIKTPEQLIADIAITTRNLQVVRQYELGQTQTLPEKTLDTQADFDLAV